MLRLDHTDAGLDRDRACRARGSGAKVQSHLFLCLAHLSMGSLQNHRLLHVQAPLQMCHHVDKSPHCIHIQPCSSVCLHYRHVPIPRHSTSRGAIEFLSYVFFYIYTYIFIIYLYLYLLVYIPIYLYIYIAIYIYLYLYPLLLMFPKARSTMAWALAAPG